MNVFLLGLLRGLSNRGFATDVLTRATGETVEVSAPFPGVRVFHVPCGWKEPPSRESAFASLGLFVDRCRILMRGERIEPRVVSAHYWMSGVAARDLAGAPMILCYHTVEARKVPAPGGGREPLPRIPKALLARRARDFRATPCCHYSTNVLSRQLGPARPLKQAPEPIAKQLRSLATARAACGTGQRPERRPPPKPASEGPACGPGQRPERRPPFDRTSMRPPCGRP